MTKPTKICAELPGCDTIGGEGKKSNTSEEGEKQHQTRPKQHQHHLPPPTPTHPSTTPFESGSNFQNTKNEVRTRCTTHQTPNENDLPFLATLGPPPCVPLRCPIASIFDCKTTPTLNPTVSPPRRALRQGRSAGSARSRRDAVGGARRRRRRRPRAPDAAAHRGTPPAAARARVELAGVPARGQPVWRRDAGTTRRGRWAVHAGGSALQSVPGGGGCARGHPQARPRREGKRRDGVGGWAMSDKRLAFT